MRDTDPLETFHNVIVTDTRPLLPSKPGGPSQEKSVRCKFADGRERFVARSQVPSYQTFPDPGEPFDLEVSEWMVSAWAESDSRPPEIAKIENVVCLRQLSPRSILVRMPDGKEEVVPTKGIDPGSPVQTDGDRGTLWIAPWCAKMKGWAYTPANQETSRGGHPRATGSDVSSDLGVNPDDQIPF
jgi:hypothetical protein